MDGDRTPVARGWQIAFWVYVVLAVALLFTGGPPAEVGKGVNLVPMRTIGNTLAMGNNLAIVLLAVNTCLLAPIGAALALRAHIPRLSGAFLIVLAVSVAIETIQFVVPGARSTDVDDVILNVAGGFSAFVVVAFLRRKSYGVLGTRVESSGAQ